MTSPIDQNRDLDTLLALLRSDDLAKRQQAAITLSGIRDPRVVDALLNALDDTDATVRANVVAGLGVNKAENALSALIPLLKDPNDIVRERTATALAQIGTPDVIEPLIDALDDAKAWVRNRVAYVLGASGDARAIEPLIELLDHHDSSTQGVAAWALGSLGAKSAIQPLLGLTHDKVASVRGNASWALGEMGDASLVSPLIGLLKDKDPEVRGKTAWALGTLGHALGVDTMVKPLTRLLDDFAPIKDSSAHIFVCQYAAEALVQIGTDDAKRAVESWRPRAQQALAPYRLQEMIKSLGHPEGGVRDEAVTALVQTGVDAIEPLIQALSHKNVRVRQNAAKALGLLGALQAVPALIKALADGDSGVWSQSVGALAKIPSAVHLLKTTLDTSAHQRVKMGVSVALWRLQRDEKAFKWVLIAMQDSDLLVQSSAITSLWTQPDERALATLQIVLTPEDTMLNRYILQALQAIGTHGAMGTIGHWMAQRQGDA